ncbi:phospholipase A [Aequorivita vladivostokensis]|uniref:phospholipase A n=1 Tax=Aequorivita vladivostokensis TaxID=171194 RepID=UPI000698DEDE|nr:phospholipase A [Aequorivita vladivostokensis]MAB56046.1 phospholipase [Aequorivita sp.]MBF31088.1 phospholipase [Aequorivita sp.]HBL79500.1 phospholipase [Aequorivita sp.]|tara:strand:+ start:20540 stop:21433 length:894 start_codon:yes stop_codon:yes gene_type:complete
MNTPIPYFLTFFILSSLNCNSQNIDSYPTLAETWQLDSLSASKRIEFKILSYKPLYLLLGNYTTNVNNTPTSENPNNVVEEPIGYNHTELAFQISFKTKILHNIFGKEIGGDVWGAYTQSSRWQLYNNTLSRPFRETNYQPEAFLLIATPYSLGNFKGVFAGVGLNHQSNGRSNPLSRSWNRVIFQFGWEIKKLQIVLKPWVRLPQDKSNDDNPDIQDYMGRVQLDLSYAFGKHNFELAARHSLRDGSENRASARLDYSYRLIKNLKLHGQIFTGYGESMIDYNHNQTTFGLGISLY